MPGSSCPPQLVSLCPILPTSWAVVVVPCAGGFIASQQQESAVSCRLSVFLPRYPRPLPPCHRHNPKWAVGPSKRFPSRCQKSAGYGTVSPEYHQFRRSLCSNGPLIVATNKP